MIDEKLKRYASLIVDTAVAIRKGQILYIEAAVGAADFVSLVAETALESGAADVCVRWMDPAVDRLRLASPGCTLEAVGAEQAEADWIIGRGGAFLRLESPDLLAFEGIPAQRVHLRSDGEMKLHGAFRSRGTAQNTIACAATPTWASYVFPELPPALALDRLWECIIGSVMADAEDPAEKWRAVISETGRHCALLNEKKYRRLHITGDRTDLYVSLHEKQFWIGGGATTPDGVFFMPNLPSYEVFTSPMASMTEGCVASTLPLNYNGGVIRGIDLTFRAGRVVSYHAEEGEELLEQILTADPDSDRLGEVAVVAHGSPVEKQGITFYTTVCDENAACHLALGRGFNMGGPAAGKEQDINESSVHVDFMIGDESTCIRGETGSGAWEDILIRGAWVV